MQTETFSTTTQNKNGHHSTDPYFEERINLQEVYFKECIPQTSCLQVFHINQPCLSPMWIQVTSQVRIGWRFKSPRRKAIIFRFLRITSQKIFRNLVISFQLFYWVNKIKRWFTIIIIKCLLWWFITVTSAQPQGANSRFFAAAFSRVIPSQVGYVTIGKNC